MKHLKLILMLIALGWAPHSFAKKAKRQGFNFGASFGFETKPEPQLVPRTTGDNKRAQETSSFANPHVGYAFFNVLNIGIMAHQKSTAGTTSIRGITPNSSIESEYEADLLGGGLFMRFLFGKALYLGSNIGYFQRETKIANVYTIDSNSSQFSGQRDHLTIKSSGLGFSGSAGIELPVAYGFFTTFNLTRSIYLLNPHSKSTNVGKVDGEEAQTQLSFGLSHYL